MHEYAFSIADAPFRVTSECPIDFTKSVLSPPGGNGSKKELTLRVRETETPSPQGIFLTESAGKRFYQTPDGVCVLLMDYRTNLPIVRALCRPDGAELDVSRAYHRTDGSLNGETLLSALDLPYLLLHRDALVLHAASIGWEGEAVLFSAPSGTGKSTQAALWEKYHGAKQLNGDKVAVGLSGAQALAYGFPFCGTSGISCDYRLPLRALIFLRQAPENRIRRLRGAEALKELLDNAFGHDALPAYVERMLACAAGLLEATPAYRLSCTPDERAVQTLENVLKENENGHTVPAIH